VTKRRRKKKEEEEEDISNIYVNRNPSSVCGNETCGLISVHSDKESERERERERNM
jgi:hypothetical protein